MRPYICVLFYLCPDPRMVAETHMLWNFYLYEDTHESDVFYHLTLNVSHLFVVPLLVNVLAMPCRVLRVAFCLNSAI